MPMPRPSATRGVFIRTDVAFHYELTVITRNPVFTGVHDALVGWLIDQRTTTIHMPDADRLSVRDHTAIYEAVAARDPMRAFHEMTSHLQADQRALSRIRSGCRTRSCGKSPATSPAGSSASGNPCGWPGQGPAMNRASRRRPRRARARRAGKQGRMTAAVEAGRIASARGAARVEAEGAGMTTVVLGAGAVGTATAWYLSKSGHDVVLVERQAGAAMETSWGNGGVIHASEVEPWSQPGMPMKIIKWLGKENAPLLLRYGAIPHIWRWGIEFARNCTPERFRENAKANLRSGASFAASPCRRSAPKPESPMTAPPAACSRSTDPGNRWTPPSAPRPFSRSTGCSTSASTPSAAWSWSRP